MFKFAQSSFVVDIARKMWQGKLPLGVQYYYYIQLVEKRNANVSVIACATFWSVLNIFLILWFRPRIDASWQFVVYIKRTTPFSMETVIDTALDDLCTCQSIRRSLLCEQPLCSALTVGHFDFSMPRFVAVCLVSSSVHGVWSGFSIFTLECHVHRPD